MRHRQNHYIFVFCIILKIFLQFSPALDYRASASINFPLLIFLYTYIFSLCRNIAWKKLCTFLPIYIAPFLNVYSNVWGNLPIANLLYLILQWLIWPLVAFFAVEHLSNKSQRFIVVSFFICFAITALTTFLGCLIYPDAARSQANGNFAETNPELLALYRSMNIGSFLFVYTVVPMLPLLLYSLRTKLYNKWLVGCILILLSVTIYKTQYATAFLIGLIACIFLLLPLRLTAKNIKKRLIGIIVLSILCIPIFALFFDILAENVESEILSQRFQEISSFFNNDTSLEEDSDLGVRFQLWTGSFKGFLEHPITGCYIWGKEETMKWLGGHSFILDMMCKWGILGLFLVILMFKSIYKLFILPYKNQPIYVYAYVAYWINIVQCLVNTTTAEIIFVFLIPLLILGNKKQEIKYSYK